MAGTINRYGRQSGIVIFSCDNIGKVPDMGPAEINRWLSEVLFLKAYYHFYLLRMYGPIPIMDKTMPINATTEEVRVYRQPVDKVVDYITSLLDSAAVNLPSIIQNRSTDLGRITRPAALAIKARVLVTAASPLFNGNTDFMALRNGDGKQGDSAMLFNPVKDPTKWDRAVKACKEAIVDAEGAGTMLYSFVPLTTISDRLKREMTIRNSIADKWNNELIWGLAIPDGSWIQGWSTPRLDPAKLGNDGCRTGAPTPRHHAARGDRAARAGPGQAGGARHGSARRPRPGSAPSSTTRSPAGPTSTAAAGATSTSPTPPRRRAGVAQPRRLRAARPRCSPTTTCGRS